MPVIAPRIFPSIFLIIYRMNAEETLRRQRESKDRKKAFEAAEERHRKDVLTQRKQQHRQTLSQAKIYSGTYFSYYSRY